MLAVTSGHNEVAQLLVDHGAQVDCTDKNLRTALHRAVSYVWKTLLQFALPGT